MSLMLTWRRDSHPSRCPATRMRTHMLWPRGMCALSCCVMWADGRAARGKSSFVLLITPCKKAKNPYPARKRAHLATLLVAELPGRYKSVDA